MASSQAVYDLFLRNWKSGAAKESHLDAAIAKGFLTQEDKEAIMATPKNPGVQ